MRHEAGKRSRDLPSRRRIVSTGAGLLLEDSSRSRDNPIGAGFSPRHQVVIPYFGGFDWRIGERARFVDANTVLFVNGGQEFSEAHPLEVGHGSAIVTPDAELLDELLPGAGPIGHRFARECRPIDNVLRLLAHTLLFAPAVDPMARQEGTLRLVRAALDGRRQRIDARGRNVVERAKRFLHARALDRITLDEVARHVGVSATYLTQSFSHCEGVPLYRYHLRLRLNKALMELPKRGDITSLALDLGFSSHSHFTAAFRSAFGMSPSAFRDGHSDWSWSEAA